MVNNIFKKPSLPTHFHSVFGILLLLTEWIQVECLYISLLDQIVTHGQHRYLQGNLEMWFRDHYPVVTNPTVKSYVITLSFQEIILMAENHYPKQVLTLLIASAAPLCVTMCAWFSPSQILTNWMCTSYPVSSFFYLDIPARKIRKYWNKRNQYNTVTINLLNTVLLYYCIVKRYLVIMELPRVLCMQAF